MTVADRTGWTRTAGWKDRALVAFFTASALAVAGLWAGYFLDGTAAASPLRPADETGTLIGRTVAAGSAGLVLAVAAAGLWRGRPSAEGIGLLGAGMVGYASLNTLGETLAAGSGESALLALVLVATAVAVGRPRGRSPSAVAFGLAAVVAGWLVLRFVSAADGALTDAVTVTSWPGPHYLAEAVMALATLTGLLAWRRGRPWGARLAVAGFGTYCYSTLNALDWASVNDQTIIPVLVLTLGAAIAGAVHLVNTGAIHVGDRRRDRVA